MAAGRLDELLENGFRDLRGTLPWGRRWKLGALSWL